MRSVMVVSISVRPGLNAKPNEEFYEVAEVVAEEINRASNQ